jgi:hypothetical protein
MLLEAKVRGNSSTHCGPGLCMTEAAAVTVDPQPPGLLYVLNAALLYKLQPGVQPARLHHVHPVLLQEV